MIEKLDAATAPLLPALQIFKTDLVAFDAVWREAKKAELRDLYDRLEWKPAAGDKMHLFETKPSGGLRRTIYTGRSVICNITHVQGGYFLNANQYMLSIHLETKYYETIGTRLAEARTAAGLKEGQAALLSKRSTAELLDFEYGQRKPVQAELCTFADLYKVSVDWLLGHQTIFDLDEQTEQMARKLKHPSLAMRLLRMFASIPE